MQDVSTTENGNVVSVVTDGKEQPNIDQAGLNPSGTDINREGAQVGNSQQSSIGDPEPSIPGPRQDFPLEQQSQATQNSAGRAGI